MGYIREGKIDESGFKRILKHTENGRPWAMLTAFRGELNDHENYQRNKELEAILRQGIDGKPLGAAKVIGHYGETVTGDDPKPNKAQKRHRSLVRHYREQPKIEKDINVEPDWYMSKRKLKRDKFINTVERFAECKAYTVEYSRLVRETEEKAERQVTEASYFIPAPRGVEYEVFLKFIAGIIKHFSQDSALVSDGQGSTHLLTIDSDSPTGYDLLTTGIKKGKIDMQSLGNIKAGTSAYSEIPSGKGQPRKTFVFEGIVTPSGWAHAFALDGRNIKFREADFI